MAALKEVIGALDKRTQDRLMKKYRVTTVRQLVNRYKKEGGLRALVGDLNPPELRKSLTVLDKSELQAVVYGALAFDSKVSEFFPDGDNVLSLRQLGGIMERLCGWSKDSFTEATYEKLIEMLNRFGIDVEEYDLHKLKKGGKKAASRQVKLKRMFVG